MAFFRYFTVISYWILTVLWSFIFVFYIRKIINRKLGSKLLFTLLTILAIDSFRTLFESLYFGFWFTSLEGFLPESIHAVLVRPENVFIPKSINVIAALLIIVILLKHWIPEELAERKRDMAHTEELKGEIDRRKAIERKLMKNEEQLMEAQKQAQLGYYVLNINEMKWSSSIVLDEIFGIDDDYTRDYEGWVNLLHPEDRDMMISYLEKFVLSEHEEFNKEYRIVNLRDRKTVWIHGIGHLKFDGDGSLYEMFGTIQDVTEHKKLITDLEDALQNIKILGGLIPICSKCKNVRDDKGYWEHLESYIDRHSDMSFSHSLCPKCAKELYGDEKWFGRMTEED